MTTQKATQTQLSEMAGRYAYRAIENLALAAAFEELIEDGSHNEGQLWFLTRAMCAEHGVDYVERVKFARNRAIFVASRYNKNTNQE